jgi:hypothetical protein
MNKLFSRFITLLLLAVLGVTAQAQPPQSVQGGSNPGEAVGRQHGFMERANPIAVERAIRAQERHTDALLKEPGVHGTGVSWRADGEMVVKVYVSRGHSGKGSKIPASIDGVPVEIHAIGPFYALNIPCENRAGGYCDSAVEPEFSASVVDPDERHARPIPIGVSAGHVDITAGTVGCRVTSGCHTYALSNAHVFADENKGDPGDEILQPGPSDGGVSPRDRIGTLFESKKIIMSRIAGNRVDAAIATVTTKKMGYETPSNGYGRPRPAIANAALNMDVMKYGRTTGMTYGYVSDVNVTVVVEYDSGDARFVDQIMISPTAGTNFSSPGDSGSLVVGSGGIIHRRPVGLLFAGADGVTLANPIGFVLNAFDVDLDIDDGG